MKRARRADRDRRAAAMLPPPAVANCETCGDSGEVMGWGPELPTFWPCPDCPDPAKCHDCGSSRLNRHGYCKACGSARTDVLAPVAPRRGSSGDVQ